MRNIRLILFTLLIVAVGAVVVYLVTRLAEAAAMPAFAQSNSPKQTKTAPDSDAVDVDEMFNDGIIRVGATARAGEYVIECLDRKHDLTVSGVPKEDGALVISCGR